ADILADAPEHLCDQVAQGDLTQTFVSQPSPPLLHAGPSAGRGTRSDGSGIPRIFHIVPRRLAEDQANETDVVRQHADQTVPDRDDQVLRRRDHALEPRDIQVQIAMVQLRDDVLLHDLAQDLQIQDEPRLRIHLALDRHVQLVVVSVPVRARARAEDLVVPLGAPVLTRQPMRGGKVQPPGHSHAWHTSPPSPAPDRHGARPTRADRPGAGTTRAPATEGAPRCRGYASRPTARTKKAGPRPRGPAPGSVP